MKTRLSFVSNSSSCSYVIAIKTWTPESTKLIELIRSTRHEFLGDPTGMDCDGAKEILCDYRADMKGAIQRCAESSAYPPDKKVNPQCGFTFTHGQQVEWSKEEMLQLKENTELVEEAEGEVFKISISYGDNEVSDLFDSLQQEGVLEVLVDWN